MSDQPRAGYRVLDHRAEPTRDSGVRPRLLDLFCGAGGAAKGYDLAGFDVVGIDIAPQPNYPYTFHQLDAMMILRSFAVGGPIATFNAIHASPPCHDHSAMAGLVGKDGTGWMLDATIDFLRRIGLPWVVENVGNARMPNDVPVIQLCGQHFDLRVRRHRKFASSFPMLVPTCVHKRSDPPPIGVYGGGPSKDMRRRGRSFGVKGTADESREAMGIDWMTRKELAQAIPPAYTEYVGGFLMDHAGR